MAITYRGIAEDGDLTNTEMDSNFQTCENRWEGSDVASASAFPLTDNYNYFTVSGTTTIDTFSGTRHTGDQVTLKFTSTVTLTHSANLKMPGQVSYTTEAGDVATFVQITSVVWECTNYLPYRVWDTAITQSVDDNSERKATTAYVQQQLSSVNGAWTSVATFNTTGTTLGETTAIPAGATEIRISVYAILNTTISTTLTAQLLAADTATYSNTTYEGCSGRDNEIEVAWTDGVVLDVLAGGDSSVGVGYIRLIKMSADDTWLVYGRHGTETGTNYSYRMAGYMELAGEMDRLKIIAEGGTGSFSGTAYVEAYVP